MIITVVRLKTIYFVQFIKMITLIGKQIRLVIKDGIYFFKQILITICTTKWAVRESSKPNHSAFNTSASK